MEKEEVVAKKSKRVDHKVRIFVCLERFSFLSHVLHYSYKFKNIFLLADSPVIRLIALLLRTQNSCF